MKLPRWWQRWRERRVLRAWARASTDELARAKAEAIFAALRERRPLCRHCLNPYTVEPREFADKFRVRAILMIPDSEPDLMLCDACFDTVSAVYNPRATIPGTSNSGPPNLLLQKLN